MKFMKLGTRPDTFYTEEATRTIHSDLPSNLTIRINNTTYLLHKFPLVPKCGLLQRLCSDNRDSSNAALELHDIPGGEEAFELCAKFCYGIQINLSAHNFVSALCAAKFLRMTESVEKGNFVSKLEFFFTSCILEGWKDSVVTLQATQRLPEWSENLGIIRRCIDSVVEKILTPTEKVTWSYTYTRPGYEHNQRNRSVPRDWWTEDIANLDVDLFRCILIAIGSTNMFPPQLIGEALHVYACRWLPDITKISPSEASASQTEISVDRRKLLETIVSLIPEAQGSVSVGFLLRLLNMAKLLGASLAVKMKLIMKCGSQLEEASLNDLLLPSHSAEDQHFYDIDLVEAVVESYFMKWRIEHQPSGLHNESAIRLIRKVANLTDSYLQVVARDINLPVHKVVSLAKVLPEIARPQHDDLYKAIDIYLEAHPEVPKAEKKLLCGILDCRKLSSEVCAHVVRNDKLPVRTIVQVLFFEQERCSRDGLRKLKLDAVENTSKDESSRSKTPGSGGRVHNKLWRSDQKHEIENNETLVEKRALGLEKGNRRENIVGSSGIKPDPEKMAVQRSKSRHGQNSGREGVHKK